MYTVQCCIFLFLKTWPRANNFGDFFRFRFKKPDFSERRAGYHCSSPKPIYGPQSQEDRTVRGDLLWIWLSTNQCRLCHLDSRGLAQSKWKWKKWREKHSSTHSLRTSTGTPTTRLSSFIFVCSHISFMRPCLQYLLNSIPLPTPSPHATLLPQNLNNSTLRSQYKLSHSSLSHLMFWTATRSAYKTLRSQYVRTER